MNILEALALYLHSRSIGVYRDSGSPIRESEVGIFLERMPPEPSRVIVIAAYEGISSDSKLPYDLPRIQFMVRGSRNPADSREIAQSIYDLFHGFGPSNVFGIGVQLILGLFSGPVYAGIDRNELNVHTVNIEVEFKNPNRRM
ncbi:MAG: minor capsid protein [Pseudonocardiaceae bacterium]